MERPFRILSIDGGGVKGILPARILSLMEEKLHINIYDSFDLIVGTSTGSIVAGAIATKYSLSQLVADYKKEAPKIFKKRWNLCGSLRSKYDGKNLEFFLLKKLGYVRLGEIEKPLVLNATNVTKWGVHVFKSGYQEKFRKGDYTRDGEVPLFKAILASCSAPAYFDPVNIEGTLVCDGGIWANNPSLVAYTEAKSNFKKDSIKILSLGTGKIKNGYQKSKIRHWGLGTGWGRLKLVDFMMSCQVDFPQNSLELIDSEMILRINPDINFCKLDDCEKINILQAEADKLFTKKNKKISKFLDINQELEKNET